MRHITDTRPGSFVLVNIHGSTFEELVVAVQDVQHDCLRGGDYDDAAVITTNHQPALLWEVDTSRQHHLLTPLLLNSYILLPRIFPFLSMTYILPYFTVATNFNNLNSMV